MAGLHLAGYFFLLLLPGFPPLLPQPMTNGLGDQQGELFEALAEFSQGV